jgi:hypothetical protein
VPGRGLILRVGETAEFDTGMPHGMAPADHQPIEALLLFGAQGERMAVAARTVRTTGNSDQDGVR